jgi:ABC-type branched-subunit amino acid transport system permease subunit
MRTLTDRIRVWALAAFLAAILAIGATGPDYLLTLVLSAMLFGLFAACVDVSIGYAGVFSLGSTLFFANGAYATALAQRQHAGMAVEILAGALVSGGLAFVLGAAGLTARRTSIRFAILTLVVSLSFEQLAVTNYDFAGGSNGLPGIKPLAILGRNVLLRQQYFEIVAIIAVSLFGLVFLMNSYFGKVLLLARDVPERAEALGHDVRFLKIWALVLTAAVSGLCGSIYVTVNGIAFPGMFGILPNILVVIWVAAGGAGTTIGPFLSGAVLNLIESALGSAYVNVYRLIMGVILVLVVSYAPSGLWGGSSIGRNR